MFKMEAKMISLASDNYAGAHPEIVAAAGAAATGTGSAYGADPWMAIAEDRFKKIFGDEISVFFVMTGTAANVLSIDAVTRPFESVLISDCAHMHVDECGAPERFTGTKNGMMFGEAVVYFSHDYDDAFQYTRKQAMQGFTFSLLNFIKTGKKTPESLPQGLLTRSAYQSLA